MIDDTGKELLHAPCRSSRSVLSGRMASKNRHLSDPKCLAVAHRVGHSYRSGRNRFSFVQALQRYPFLAFTTLSIMNEGCI